MPTYFDNCIRKWLITGKQLRDVSQQVEYRELNLLKARPSESWLFIIAKRPDERDLILAVDRMLKGR